MPHKSNIIRFNTLLGSIGRAKEKKDIIADFTDGRTESTVDLSDNELRDLMAVLQQLAPKPEDKANKMRRKIIAIAHQLQWYITDAEGTLILKRGKAQIDYKHLDQWCVKHGSFGKVMNAHNVAELTVLVTNLERVLAHHLTKGIATA